LDQRKTIEYRLRRNPPSFLVEHCRRPTRRRFLRLQYKLVTNSRMSLISITFHCILYLVILIFLVVRLRLIRFDDSTTAMKIQRCSHFCRDRNQHHHSTTMATISSWFGSRAINESKNADDSTEMWQLQAIGAHKGNVPRT
jgi:hypothetical protein